MILSINIPSIAPGPIDVPLVEIPCTVGEAVVALVAPIPTRDAPAPASTEGMSVRVPLTIEELDDDVMVVEALAVFVKPAISQAPSIPKVGLEE